MDMQFIEVDPEKFNDRCPNCGGKKFLEVSITGNQPDGKRKHIHGLKCFDCGVILTPKVKEKI